VPASNVVEPLVGAQDQVGQFFGALDNVGRPQVEILRYADPPGEFVNTNEYEDSGNKSLPDIFNPRLDSNGQQVFVPSTDPSSQPTLVPG